MPDPSAVVGRVVRLDPPIEERPRGARTVEIGGDVRATIDADNAQSEGLARLLDGAARLRRPVYLELDLPTGRIERLLLPGVGRVARSRALADGSLEVQLDASHAILTLRISNPDFSAFSESLRASEQDRRTVLVVTFEDDGTIIDVRGFRPGPDGDLPPLPPIPVPKWPPLDWIEKFLRWILRWPIWPWRWWWWWGCTSAANAQQVFNAMAATTCAPLTVPAPCIPFLYPDDGCWARAHEMVRLMLAMGLKPYKVWIQGWPLNPDTRNHPNCEVTWGWHVAPTLCVRTKWWWFWGTRMVIDPALFTKPVSKATWKSVQENPNATLTDTDGTYYNWIWSQPDDVGYADTNYYLSYYRLQLQARAMQSGAPPYSNCP